MVAAALIGAGGYAWVLSGLAEFSQPAAVVTAVPILAVGLLVFVPAGRPSTRDMSAPEPRLLAGWVVLLALFVVWELREYLGSPRLDYPTISSIFDGFFRRSRMAKAAAILVWLGVGAYLARSGVAARRRQAPEPSPAPQGPETPL